MGKENDVAVDVSAAPANEKLSGQDFGHGQADSSSSSAAAASAVACRPTRVIFISPHTGLSRRIQVHDHSKALLSQYHGEIDDSLRDAAKALWKQPDNWAGDAALYTIRRNNWLATKFEVFAGDVADDKATAKPEPIAHWKASHWSVGTSNFTFPPGSPHSTHPIEMSMPNRWRRAERFVVDSVPYNWRPNHRVLDFTKWTLYKEVAGSSVEVARYRRVWAWGTGGVIVVDDSQVDPLLAVLTMCAILKKARQRSAERSSGGGGGGGGC